MKRLEKFREDFNEALSLMSPSLYSPSKIISEDDKRDILFSAMFGMLSGIAENLAILVDRLEEEKENKEGAEDY